MALIGEMQYLTIGGNTYSIPTSGGSTVTIERALTSGTKSATISVDGTSYDLYAPTPNAGTVTSVRVQATSPVQSSTSTAQSSTLNTTISLANGYGDTKNPYGTKTANYVLAGPTSGSAAAPSFRTLVAADIPDLSGIYLTSHLMGSGAISVSDNNITLKLIESSEPRSIVGISHSSYQNISGLYIIADDGSVDGNYIFIPDIEGVSTASQQIINSIPTKVSQLTNDAGYVTSSGVTSITLKAGNGISLDTDDTAITTTGTRTISHADTSSQASSSNSGRTYIQSITLDTYGHVTGISTATESVTNTDTKLQVAAVTSGTTYYPIVGTGTTAATRQYDTTGFIYVGTNGTANGTNGNALLTLGNSTASTTANWKKGTVRLYGTTAYYTDLVSGAPSANRTITFPNATGTVALTSQIPTVPSSTESATTGITIAAHGTTSIGSASNWSAGTASTWAFEEITIPNVTAAGSASTWAFEEISIPNVTSAGTASSWTFEEKTIPNVTAAGSGSFTATVTNHVLSFSHTHTAPTIGTAIKVQSKSGGSNGTAPTLGTAIKVQSKSSGSNGTAPTLGTAIKVQSKKSGANSTVPSLTVTSTTVTTGTTHSITDNGHSHAL